MIIVPAYQNFVPGPGHTRLPSRHEIAEAKERGLPEPQAVVIQEEHKRIGSPVRKLGYENFVPGPGHKLMPTWEQIQREEAATKEAALELEHESQSPSEEAPGDPDVHQCQTCEKTFGTYKQLHGHRLTHRGK